MSKLEIFAHRGASYYAPENTLPAFELAHEQGADGIELDVQLTKDGKVVVIHDETIDRVSTGTGYVRDYTLSELRKFSFHNQIREYAGHAEIPLLREVLKLVKPWGIKVNIELKTGIFWYPEIEEKIVRIVWEENMEEKVIYSSFNHYSIQKIQEIKPDADVAYLFSDVIIDAHKYSGYNGVKGLHIPLYQAEMRNILEKYQKSNLPIRVWTADRRKELEMLIHAGVTAIFTNRPDVAMKVRQEMNTLYK